MAKRYRGQSEQRRRKKQRIRRMETPGAGRPKAWAVSELAGIEQYIARLEGPLGSTLPQKWVAGQLRHYHARAVMVRAEIETCVEEEGNG